MFLILDPNTIRGNGNVRVMCLNVDNIKSISIWEDVHAESIHDRWAIKFEFMNGTSMEGPRFPDERMAEQHMLYMFQNATELGRKGRI